MAIQCRSRKGANGVGVTLPFFLALQNIIGNHISPRH